MAYNYEVERREAIDAGKQALDSLRAALRELDGARTWGIFDIFGGNLITGMAKHSKINNAQNYINRARYDLQNFSRELDDISQYGNYDIKVDSFLTFADFFFDNFIVDFMVQSKINQARAQVTEAIQRVEEILRMI